MTDSYADPDETEVEAQARMNATLPRVIDFLGLNKGATMDDIEAAVKAKNKRSKRAPVGTVGVDPSGRVKFAGYECWLWADQVMAFRDLLNEKIEEIVDLDGVYDKKEGVALRNEKKNSN